MAWNDTGAEEPNPRLDAALAYVNRLQWSVVPLHWIDQGRCSCGAENCRTPGKHPNARYAPNGTHSASKDPATVRAWYEAEPRLNIGIALGEASGIVVLDVDPRNGGDDSLHALLQKHGPMPATASAITGGNGTHYIFKDTGQRVRTPGKGLDALSNGKLIVVEPSSHASGKNYAWDNETDPLQGHVIALPPLWLIDVVKRQNLKAFLNAPAVGYLDAFRIADIRSALGALDVDDYATWVAVGQALHSTEAPEAFEIWDTWAQGSAKYTNGDTSKKWDTFTVGRGLHVESIFAWAQDRGWTGETSMPKPEPVAVERIAKPAPRERVSDTPSHLLRIPGVLQDLVDAINETAPKPQPQFAVQTALAFGSVILGRRYVSQLNNYTSLYFVAVGESSSGKEFGRTVCEKALEQCALGMLIGPSGYTSDSAVISELLEKPAHIAIMDEFGAMLRNAMAQANFHKRQMLEQLKSIWGLCHGSVRPNARSTLGLPSARKKSLPTQIIQRPALTILGMSTPKQFYEALTEDAIEGGFLSRLIIVQTNLGRMESNDSAIIFDTPQTIIDWTAATRAGSGNLAGVELGADMVPDACRVAISPEALRLFKAYERELIAVANALEREGLAELEGRSREKALRVAVILSCSDNPLEPSISAAHAEWAIDYVRHYTAQTVAAVREHMTAGKFSKWCSIVLDKLRKNAEGGTLARERGLTWAEITHGCRPLQELDERQIRSVLGAMVAREQIGGAPKSEGGRGKPRGAAYVLISSAPTGTKEFAL